MLTLGIDIGSRTAKAVLLDAGSEKVVACFVKDVTVDKQSDVLVLLDAVLQAAGISAADIERTIATGYGRSTVSFATTTVTEITCHALGVSLLFEDARAIVDIGGQDSKVIVVDGGGLVRDFVMNDRCAAGTGRFLESAARILGTDIERMSLLSENASQVPEISSMCVVFAESEVLGLLSKGVPAADLAAGLFDSFARRIAGLAQRCRYEPPVVFTGGVAGCSAMVRALERQLGESLYVPDDPRVTGALGAAAIAARQMERRVNCISGKIIVREI